MASVFKLKTTFHDEKKEPTGRKEPPAIRGKKMSGKRDIEGLVSCPPYGISTSLYSNRPRTTAGYQTPPSEKPPPQGGISSAAAFHPTRTFPILSSRRFLGRDLAGVLLCHFEFLSGVTALLWFFAFFHGQSPHPSFVMPEIFCRASLARAVRESQVLFAPFLKKGAQKTAADEKSPEKVSAFPEGMKCFRPVHWISGCVRRHRRAIPSRYRS